jgi:hypothetical protein
VSAPARILCGAVTVAAACLGLGVTIVVRLADQFARSVGADDWEPGNEGDPHPWPERDDLCLRQPYEGRSWCLRHGQYEADSDEAGQWVPVRTWRGDSEGWEDR